MRAIIDRLSDPESRLLTTERQQTASGEGTLEVAHEALIRGWPQLRKWIETDRAGLRTHLRLTDAAKEWADAVTEAKEGALYAGARLAVATEWAASHRDELGALEAAFLSASQEHERQKQADEAEKNRRLAEAEHAAGRGGRGRASVRAESTQPGEQKADSRQEARGAASRVVLAKPSLLASEESWQTNQSPDRGCGLLLAVGRRSETCGRTGEQRRRPRLKEQEDAEAARKSANTPSKEKLANENEKRAKAQAAIATSRQLAALSASERNKRLDRSLLLAVEALRTENTFEARDSLYKALQDRPDSHRSCTSRRATSRAWPSAPTARPSPPDTRVGGGGGGVVLWDVAGRSGWRTEPLAVKEGDVTSVAFSPDGKTLAAGYGGVGGGGGGVVLWDVAGRKRLADGTARREGGRRHERGLQPRRQDPRRRIRVGGGGGGVVLWDVAGRKRLADGPARREGGRRHERGLQPRRQDPRRRIHVPAAAAAAWCCGTWPARKRLAEEPLAVKEGDVSSVAFSPDGKTLAAGYSVPAAAAAAWCCGTRPAASGWRSEPLAVKEGDVSSVAFSPDGKTLAAGYSASAAASAAAWCCGTWPAASGWRSEPLAVKEGDVSSVAFSPDGKTLAAGYGVLRRRRRRGAVGRGRRERLVGRTARREGGLRQ